MGRRSAKSVVSLCLSVVAMIAAGCSSSDAPPAPPPAGTSDGGAAEGTFATTKIGAAGGTVNGPAGARLTVPPGALASDTPITISVAQANQVPSLTAGYALVGQVYSFEPHGLTFAQPVTITLPISSTASAATLVAFRAQPAGRWESVDAQLGTVATITTPGFSFYGLMRSTFPDGGGGACAGRVPDGAAPTGTLSTMVGTVPEDRMFNAPEVNLASLVDGYAARVPTGGIQIHMTSYPRACGTYKRGLDQIGGKEWMVFLASGSITAQTYREFLVRNRSTAQPSVKPGACAANGFDGGSHRVGGSVTIESVTASRIAGRFAITFEGATLSGGFDVPICAVDEGLDPSTCCLPGTD
jgi:hypothetical protein